MIRIATQKDISLLRSLDTHISSRALSNSIAGQHVYLLEEDGNTMGWLRFNHFWDNIPFLNMLFILEPFRNQGYGTQLMSFWEAEMQKAGFCQLMTSTASNEYAQHFYQKLGFQTVGGFFPKGEAYEIILQKDLS